MKHGSFLTELNLKGLSIKESFFSDFIQDLEENKEEEGSDIESYRVFEDKHQ